MVLNKHKMVVLLLSIVLSVNANGRTENMLGSCKVSGLLQYGENIDRNNLELLKDEETIILPKWTEDVTSYYSIKSEYVIKNTTNKDLRSTLGLFFYSTFFYGEVKDKDMELEFYVNNVKTAYKIITPSKVVDWDGYTAYWAVIDIAIPVDAVVAIQTQYFNITGVSNYSNGGSAIVAYNIPTTIDHKESLYWKGNPELIIHIENFSFASWADEKYFEYCWISDIVFITKEHNIPMGTGEEWLDSIAMTGRYTDYMLDYKGNFSMANNFIGLYDFSKSLFSVTKTSECSWSITFQNKFFESYERSFVIQIKYWASSPQDGYCYVSASPPSIYLDVYGVGSTESGIISKRKLAPFELIFLTKHQLRIMRNAFYAQYGYIFKSQDLVKAFENNIDAGFIYASNPNFSESMLTDIDKANIETIRKLEEMKF
jgi:hypothetical protein